MANRQEYEKLSQRYADQQRQEGLIDVKYFLRNTDAAVTEDVCRDVNRLHDAVAKGHSITFRFNDSRKT